MSEPLHVVLLKAQVKHQQVCREAFQKLDLSEGQPKILLRLRNQDGLLQKELSNQCGVMPATMTALLQNMVVKGLVEKKETRISGGKRGYEIHLTTTGKALAEQVARIMQQIETISLDGFSDKEKKRLIEYLERVEKNLAKSHY